jgi:hypothetical protein
MNGTSARRAAHCLSDAASWTSRCERLSGPRTSGVGPTRLPRGYKIPLLPLVAGPVTMVDLGLLNPVADSLGADPETVPVAPRWPGWTGGRPPPRCSASAPAIAADVAHVLQELSDPSGNEDDANTWETSAE